MCSGLLARAMPPLNSACFTRSTCQSGAAVTRYLRCGAGRYGRAGVCAGRRQCGAEAHSALHPAPPPLAPAPPPAAAAEEGEVVHVLAGGHRGDALKGELHGGNLLKHDGLALGGDLCIDADVDGQAGAAGQWTVCRGLSSSSRRWWGSASRPSSRKHPELCSWLPLSRAHGRGSPVLVSQSQAPLPSDTPPPPPPPASSPATSALSSAGLLDMGWDAGAAVSLLGDQEERGGRPAGGVNDVGALSHCRRLWHPPEAYASGLRYRESVRHVGKASGRVECRGSGGNEFSRRSVTMQCVHCAAWTRRALMLHACRRRRRQSSPSTIRSTEGSGARGGLRAQASTLRHDAQGLHRACRVVQPRSPAVGAGATAREAGRGTCSLAAHDVVVQSGCYAGQAHCTAWDWATRPVCVGGG